MVLIVWEHVSKFKICARFFSKGKMRVVRFMSDESMGMDMNSLLVCKHLLVDERDLAALEGCSNTKLWHALKAQATWGAANGRLEIRPSTKAASCSQEFDESCVWRAKRMAHIPKLCICHVLPGCLQADMEQFCRNSAVAAHFAKKFRDKHGFLAPSAIIQRFTVDECRKGIILLFAPPRCFWSQSTCKTCACSQWAHACPLHIAEASSWASPRNLRLWLLVLKCIANRRWCKSWPEKWGCLFESMYALESFGNCQDVWLFSIDLFVPAASWLQAQVPFPTLHKTVLLALAGLLVWIAWWEWQHSSLHRRTVYARCVRQVQQQWRLCKQRRSSSPLQLGDHVTPLQCSWQMHYETSSMFRHWAWRKSLEVRLRKHFLTSALTNRIGSCWWLTFREFPPLKMVGSACIWRIPRRGVSQGITNPLDSKPTWWKTKPDGTRFREGRPRPQRYFLDLFGFHSWPCCTLAKIVSKHLAGALPLWELWVLRRRGSERSWRQEVLSDSQVQQHLSEAEPQTAVGVHGLRPTESCGPFPGCWWRLPQGAHEKEPAESAQGFWSDRILNEAIDSV